jgi:hypothetical protein
MANIGWYSVELGPGFEIDVHRAGWNPCEGQGQFYLLGTRSIVQVGCIKYCKETQSPGVSSTSPAAKPVFYSSLSK